MRDLFTKDLGWKLFSVFLAVTIWLTVHKINDESPPAVVGSTITFESLPLFVVSSTFDVSHFRLTDRAVTVTVSGPPDIMANLQGKQIRATINLTDITNAAAAKNLNRLVEVSAPAGVTLVSVTPDRVGVILPPQ